jgi:uncharacterized protein
MHYIIDGHNLIGKMPDISLEDPDDEVRLVMRLKSWLGESKRRDVTLFFDGGAGSGQLNRLSGRNIKVIFAPPQQTADALIVRHLKKLSNLREYVLVTSDREIIRAAESLRLRFMLSEEFIERMGFVFAEPKKEKGKEVKAETAVPPEKPDRLNDAEVQEWLDMFGPVPEKPKAKGKRPSPAPAPAPPPSETPEPPRKPRLRVVKDDENASLDGDEVSEWLKFFNSRKT